MVQNNIVYNVPGTYVSEQTAGSTPAALAPHEAVYMLVHSDKVGAPVGQPRFISSTVDFDNVFGQASLSWPSIELYFAQRSGAGLYCINVGAVGAYPTLAELEDTLQALDSELPQGFLLAPEFFQHASFSGTTDHNALAGVLEAHVSDTRFYWVAIIDASPTVGQAASPSALVTAALAERLGLESPLGHSFYYAPYLVDTASRTVPASAAVAGVAVRRQRQEGFRQPPAGVRYPVLGLKSVKVKVTSVEQAQLNLQGINCVRDLPRMGTVIWGARTLSADPFYRHANQRVILNVLVGSYREAFHSYIFSAVDGLGVLFGRLKATATSFLEQLRLQGALFGNTPDAAYRVVCGLENNTGDTLDAGQVNVDVYVKVSPTLEFLGIRLNKVSLASQWSDVDGGL